MSMIREEEKELTGRGSSQLSHSSSSDSLNDGNGDGDGDDRKSDDDLLSVVWSEDSAALVDDSVEPQRVRTRRLQCTSILVILSVLASAIIAPIFIFRFQRGSQIERFERDFAAIASTVQRAFGLKIAASLGTLNAMSVSSTSYAQDVGKDFILTTFPFNDMELSSASRLSEALGGGLMQIVTDEDRDEYEAACERNAGWVHEAIARQEELYGKRLLQEEEEETNFEGDSSPPLQSVKFINGVAVNIYTIINGTRVVDPGPGPYVPSWQFFPLQTRGINYNLRTLGPQIDAVDAVIEKERSVIAGTLSFVGEQFKIEADFYTGQLRRSTGDPNILYKGEPISSIFYPHFDSFDITSRRLVGMASSTIFWKFLFDEILPDNVPPIHCVLRSACVGEYSLSVEGSKAVYLGGGDWHDTTYDDMVLQATFTEILESTKFRFSDTFIPLDEDFCPYSLRIYPTQEFYEKHTTIMPMIMAVCVSAFFVLAAMVLISYEFVVKRRLVRIERVAQESGGFVCELYPEQVRERMLERLRLTSPHLMPRRRNSTCSCRPMPISSQASAVIGDIIRANREHSMDVAGEELSVIADSFPDCTILFSYLHGFADWSMNRDPEDIFILLEKVFGCLDAIAKKAHVFKINTILDAYFCATGLPRPQPDHAVRMTKFARHSLRAISDLLKTELTELFGPDTSKMEPRIGIHSGRVTAGLLAGVNVRFDVFGDTVNTASRMASSGAPGRIHASPSTAELIMENDKSMWLMERKDKVTLKGKGEMATYWLEKPTKTPQDDPLDFDSSAFLSSNFSPPPMDPLPDADDQDTASGLPDQLPSYGLFDHLQSLTENALSEEEIVFGPDSD